MNLNSGLLVFFILICSESGLANARVYDDGKKLLGVAVIFRHGDRAPIGSYPNDPYHNRMYFPEGFGQLTKQGKRRQFDLGTYFRKRYSDFLPLDYMADDILVLSSDVDRTIMSAAAALAGMYPPSQDEKFVDALPWQPIPVHGISDNMDSIIAVSRDCPKFKRIYKELCASDEFRQLSETYSDFYEYISRHTTWNITDIDTFQGLYTVLYVYQMHNPSYLPAWYVNMTQDNKELLKYLAGLSFSRETYTKELQRLKTGPLFHYLINHFESVLAGEAQKFLMLSGHDGTIVSILNTFGVYDYHPPEFASTVILELFEDLAGKVKINVYHKMNGTEEAKDVIIDGCDFDCNFEHFKVILESVEVDDVTWDQECIDS